MRISTFRDDALGDMDVVALREALTGGQVGAHEVHAAARARAQEASALNAVVTAVENPAGGVGEFAGVPSVVKDNEDLAGYPTSYGSRAVPRQPARDSSRFVSQWQRLGFETLGKTALPEFGLTATTEPLAHGATRNPWDTGHSTGGSSGGSAALVAAGVVPIAHANDGGGSIRIPAACCGLVGLKPSRGRLVGPEAMDPLPVKIVTQGVLTRSVRDTVAFYQAMGRIRPVRELPPIGPSRDPGRLRIALMTEGVGGLRVDPEVTRAVEGAAALCEELGHVVEPIDNPFGEGIARDFLRYWAMLAFSLRRLGRSVFGDAYDPGRLEPFSIHLADFFMGVSARVPGSLYRMRRFPHVYDLALGNHDVVLSPVLGSPPPALGVLGPQVAPQDHLVRLLRYASFTALQNISGAPGISLPLGMSARGLPIGVHFAARIGQEQMLLDLAAALETARPWPRIGAGSVLDPASDAGQA